MYAFRLVGGREDSVRPEDSELVDIELDVAPFGWVFDVVLECLLKEELQAEFSTDQGAFW